MEMFLIGLAVLTAPIWLILLIVLSNILFVVIDAVFTLCVIFIIALWGIGICIILSPIFGIVKLIDKAKLKW